MKHIISVEYSCASDSLNIQKISIYFKCLYFFWDQFDASLLTKSINFFRINWPQMYTQ